MAVHCDVKEKHYSSAFFKCAKPLSPKAPGCKRLNEWEFLVFLEKSLFPFPCPNQDHLSPRWGAFVEGHPRVEPSGRLGAFSGSYEMKSVWDSRMTHISMLERRVRLQNMPPKEREQMLCLHYLAVLKPENTDIICPSGHSTFHVQTLLSGSVNQMFQKPVLPPPQSIGLTSFRVKGIDAGAPNGSLLNHWFLLNTPPQRIWQVPEFCSLVSFPL